MDFKGRTRCLHQFLERHSTCYSIINREEDDTLKDVTTSWKEQQLKGLIYQYQDKNVYNVDETALFYKSGIKKGMVL
jgi:uncharacterized protein (DUF927 family)